MKNENKNYMPIKVKTSKKLAKIEAGISDTNVSSRIIDLVDTFMVNARDPSIG